MRFIPIATAISLATTAIAAPTPKNNIDVDGLVGADAVILRNAVSEEGFADAAKDSTHAKRDLVSETEGEVSQLTGEAEKELSSLSKEALALLGIPSKRDLVSETGDEVSQLTGEAEKELSSLSKEALALLGIPSKRAAAPEEDNFISIGSASASIKRDTVSDLEG